MKGDSHMKVFMAGATRSGLEKSHALPRRERGRAVVVLVVVVCVGAQGTEIYAFRRVQPTKPEACLASPAPCTAVLLPACIAAIQSHPTASPTLSHPTPDHPTPAHPT